jgi:chromosome segregation and condensation protein ScpB
MKTITIKENEVLNQIKVFSGDSKEPVAFSSLKDALGIYEHNLHDLLNSLDEKGIIKYDGSNIQLLELDGEIRTVNSNADVLSAELNKMERDSFEILKSLVDENNMVSRYILEGALLYGDLGISDFRMYHIILSLENKGLIKSIPKENGDYYRLLL